MNTHPDNENRPFAALPFWLVATFIAVPFVGYPASVIALGGLRRRGTKARDIRPTVSVLIAAFNEEGVIGDKIRNVLSQDYPDGLLQVVVVDDGSMDCTLAEIRSVEDDRLVIVEQHGRCGKGAALNAGYPHCTGEVLVLTDANAVFEADAIANLVRHFADPEVGGVCGNQENRQAGGLLALGERLYWEYDKFLKQMESYTGSIVGAHGSIYAIRREYYDPVPPGASDDYFISSGVMQRHKRLVFERNARSLETPIDSGSDQFRRRARITSRATRALYQRRRVLNPLEYGIYSWVIAGHKLWRRLASAAIFLLLPAAALAASSGRRLYAFLLQLQLLVYAAAGLGWLLRDRTSSKLLAVPYYFVVGIAGTTVGLWRFLRGERRTVWDPVRPADPGPGSARPRRAKS